MPIFRGQPQTLIYDHTTGIITDANGNIVSGVVASTWADFTGGSFDLTVARHVHVTDKHSSITGYGGSLWYIDPTAPVGYKRQLVSGPIVCTWATRLDAATYPGVRHYITDIGVRGSDWVSNGTRYILYGDRPCILKTITDLSIASTLTEAIITSVPILTDATKSCWQNGDRIRFFSQVDKPTANNVLRRTFRMGNVNTTSAALLQAVAPANTNLIICDRVELRRQSATSVRMVGQLSGNYQFIGNSSTAYQADITGLDNMDTSANYYLNFGLNQTVAAGDTTLYHRDMICELVTCGA